MNQLDLVKKEREKQVELGYTNQYNKDINRKMQMSQAASWIVQYDDENFDKEVAIIERVLKERRE